MSLPHMNVDGVQRGWQEQVLTLTVERLTLESKTQMKQTPKGNSCTLQSPPKASNMVAFTSKQTKID